MGIYFPHNRTAGSQIRRSRSNPNLVLIISTEIKFSIRVKVRNILNISHLTLVSAAICCVQILRPFPRLQKVLATKSITCSSHYVNT